jgi:hypothetical protein
MKQKTLEEVKDLAYYKTNAEEDYLQVPISVLRYISQLEQEQDKNKYSEEEVLRIIISCKEYLSFGDEFNEKEWFEQFKNK